jgi:hypothetical protein
LFRDSLNIWLEKNFVMSTSRKCPKWDVNNLLITTRYRDYFNSLSHFSIQCQRFVSIENEEKSFLMKFQRNIYSILNRSSNHIDEQDFILSERLTTKQFLSSNSTYLREQNSSSFHISTSITFTLMTRSSNESISKHYKRKTISFLRFLQNSS